MLQFDPEKRITAEEALSTFLFKQKNIHFLMGSLKTMSHYNLASKYLTGHGIILSQQRKSYRTWFMNKVLNIIHKESLCRARNKT